MSDPQEAPSLLIQEQDGDFNVWIGLSDHDPIRDTYGFVIGQGSTRDKAVADAVAALENAVGRLQLPEGKTRVRGADGRVEIR